MPEANLLQPKSERPEPVIDYFPLSGVILSVWNGWMQLRHQFGRVTP